MFSRPKPSQMVSDGPIVQNFESACFIRSLVCPSLVPKPGAFFLNLSWMNVSHVLELISTTKEPCEESSWRFTRKSRIDVELLCGEVPCVLRLRCIALELLSFIIQPYDEIIPEPRSKSHRTNTGPRCHSSLTVAAIDFPE